MEEDEISTLETMIFQVRTCWISGVLSPYLFFLFVTGSFEARLEMAWICVATPSFKIASFRNNLRNIFPCNFQVRRRRSKCPRSSSSVGRRDPTG